jgi:hypothetical protein
MAATAQLAGFFFAHASQLSWKRNVQTGRRRLYDLDTRDRDDELAAPLSVLRLLPQHFVGKIPGQQQDVIRLVSYQASVSLWDRALRYRSLPGSPSCRHTLCIRWEYPGEFVSSPQSQSFFTNACAKALLRCGQTHRRQEFRGQHLGHNDSARPGPMRSIMAAVNPRLGRLEFPSEGFH